LGLVLALPFHHPALVLIIAIVVLIVRQVAGWGRQSDRFERRPPGLDILEERYARGEINRDEYLQKKKDMTG
jgi:putative membrane protein